MIKVIERKHSIQIVCSRADWSFVSWCMDEGLMAWMEADPKDRDTAPSGTDEAFKAWKRNGCPSSMHQLTQIDKS
mgnify:FL=1